MHLVWTLLKRLDKLLSFDCFLTSWALGDERPQEPFSRLSFGENDPCNWEEKLTNKHKEIWPDTPTSALQPSRGRAPFVPCKCPVCHTDVLSNLCGITTKSGRDVPDVPRLAAKPSPGHFRGIPTTKFFYVFFVYRFFFSLCK